MAEQLSIAERIKRSQQFGSKTQAMPTVNELAGQVGITPGTTAMTAGPLATPDQRKMMGTPAQKGARIATAAGETQLEQATKLRAPAEADEKTETAKRKAAALAGALGPMGDKVTQLVDAAMTRITGQQVEGAEADSGLQLKVNSAAEVIKNLKPEAQTEVADLIAKIGANPNDTAALNRLNVVLGRTADTAIGANEIPALMAAAPDIVKAAAGTAVTKAVGETITLEDLGEMGTTQEELASLLGIDPAEIPNLTITDLQNKIAAIQQAEFGASQEVQAGMSSALLSSTERAALRDVLATMEETGLAGAEFQVGQIGKDIADGRQVVVGNETYTVEELLSSPAMTDIVKKVLDDPEAKTDFVKALKETDPDLYNWVISSKAGLEKLVTEAATGAGRYKEIQQKNLTLLKPLLNQKDFFKDLDLDVSALSDKELKIEDLPPSAQYILQQPPGAQAAAADRLASLGVGNVKNLTADQIKNLRPEDPNGPAAQWLAAQQQAKDITNLSDPNDIFSRYFQMDTDFDTLNNMAKDAQIYSSLGFDGGNAGIVVLAAPKGVIDAADAEALKQQMTQMPSLLDVANGVKPTGPATNRLKGPAPLNNEQQTLVDEMKNVFADLFFTQEEADALPWSEEKMQSVLNNLPRVNGRYVARGADIARTLEGALNRKRKAREEAEMQAQYAASAAQSKAAEKEATRKEGERRVMESGTGMLSNVARALGIKAR